MKDATATARDGLDALLAVRPVWARVAPASTLLALEGRWLLHAGPPYEDPCDPPAPVLSSAVLACLYEGWARDETEAERLVRSGEVRLGPAQSYRCVTPLAALVSPSTTMIVVEDEAGAVPPTYAPLGTTGGPDLRFGTRDTKILERLALRDSGQARIVADALALPIPLLPIALAALQAGDDLHNRTTAATAALAARFASALGTAGGEPHESFVAALGSTPLYFLTIWMAAAKLMLSAAENKAPATLVTRMAGNGVAFGVSLAGRPDDWITTPASAPRGDYLPGVAPDAQALGAIGDSAVIDALGFGGQALRFAPEVAQALKPHLDASRGDTASALLSAGHPAFAGIGVRVGIDAARIESTGIVPYVTLGMVERTGSRGLLGRGVYQPPPGLFTSAIRELDQ